jgi:hypothetical protein
MELDTECLLEARVENVERLANALGVRIPDHRGKDRHYARKLARAVLRKIEEDKLADVRAARRRMHS